ncbi:MAG: hypothetical protein F6J93_07020 [Oscillatoria sp. SIO1A7]|nr:hypothetical protein [Oscillatoria sp. SIO1A7]
MSMQGVSGMNRRDACSTENWQKLCLEIRNANSPHAHAPCPMPNSQFPYLIFLVLVGGGKN